MMDRFEHAVYGTVRASWVRALAKRLLVYVALFSSVILFSGLIVRQTDMLDKLLIYFPQREILQTPASVGLEFDEVFLNTSDGLRLHGWYVPGPGDVTLLWFHGNAGNIGHRVDNMALLHQRLGVNIFIFDYRGYGLSEGSASEAGMYLDAEAALDYLRTEKGHDLQNIVFFGRSLGGAVAAEMAARYQASGLVLESVFTSVPAMAKIAHPLLSSFVPVGAVVRSKYDSLSKMKNVRSPLLVIHGDRDELVPIDMGRQLFEAANEPKRFYSVTGASHNDTYIVGGTAYFDALESWLQSLA